MASNTGAGQAVNVTDLDVSQLGDVRRQLEEVFSCFVLWRPLLTGINTQELGQLTTSFSQLKQAQAKFKACVENAGEVKPGNRGTFGGLLMHKGLS